MWIQLSNYSCSCVVLVAYLSNCGRFIQGQFSYIVSGCWLYLSDALTSVYDVYILNYDEDVNLLFPNIHVAMFYK